MSSKVSKQYTSVTKLTTTLSRSRGRGGETPIQARRGMEMQLMSSTKSKFHFEQVNIFTQAGLTTLPNRRATHRSGSFTNFERTNAL
jgi:hypothetical protein